MTLRIPLLFLAVLTPMLAQDGFAYWPAAKLKGYSASLKPGPGGSASEQLANLGNHTYMVIRRDQSGEPEIHAGWSDVHLPQDGEATIVWGGKIEGGRLTAPGETRGGKIVGGTSQKVRAGDVVVIPAGLPHQTLVDKGKAVTVLIVKVEKK